MKILLVAPLFPPDTGVSTFRMSSFFDGLSIEHEVDVLKLGDGTNFLSQIKIIDKRYFSSIFRARVNRRNISALLIPVLKQYDLVLLSTPLYSLCEIGVAAYRANVRFIFDLRDLPDLILSEQKNDKWWPFLIAKTWLTERYIIGVAKHAQALLCVGAISAAVMQKKMSGYLNKVINVNNGFDSVDRSFVSRTKPPFSIPDKAQLNIGCVGNLHNFRNTVDLRKILTLLNDRGGVVLRHWGKLGSELSEFVSGLGRLQYVQCKTLPRQQLLQELHGVDCFLLACSADLIWEPTTSVFDYILFKKPIIYSGLRNTEAFCILENANMCVIDSDSLVKLDLDSLFESSENAEVNSNLNLYSREFSFLKLKRVIDGLV